MQKEFLIRYTEQKKLIKAVLFILLVVMIFLAIGLALQVKLKNDVVTFILALLTISISAITFGKICIRDMRITILSEASFEIESNGTKELFYRKDIEVMNYFHKHRMPPKLELKMKSGYRKFIVGNDIDGYDSLYDFYSIIKNNWHVNGKEINYKKSRRS